MKRIAKSNPSPMAITLDPDGAEMGVIHKDRSQSVYISGGFEFGQWVAIGPPDGEGKREVFLCLGDYKGDPDGIGSVFPVGEFSSNKDGLAASLRFLERLIRKHRNGASKHRSMIDIPSKADQVIYVYKDGVVMGGKHISAENVAAVIASPEMFPDAYIKDMRGNMPRGTK